LAATPDAMELVADELGLGATGARGELPWALHGRLTTSCMMRLSKAHPLLTCLVVSASTPRELVLDPPLRACATVDTEHAMSLCGGQRQSPHVSSDQNMGQRSGPH
jgi:hypothetical protein